MSSSSSSSSSGETSNDSGSESDASLDSGEETLRAKRADLLNSATLKDRIAATRNLLGRAAPITPSRAAAAASAAPAAAAAAPKQAAAPTPAAPRLPPSKPAAAPAAAISRARVPRIAAQRANEALQAEPERRNNYPPVDSADVSDVVGKQIYRVDNWEYGLQTNCRLLGTVVQLSEVLPDGAAGLGLFAGRNFAEGEVVGFLWGKFVAQEEWDTIIYRHFDPSHRAGEEDYATPVKQGIHRVLSVQLQDNGASLLLASQQCPMAYINQGHGPQTNNVAIVFPKHPFDDAVHPAYKYIRFVVKTESGRGVQQGEEFTTDYGWPAQDLQKLKDLYAAHLTQLGKARVLRTYDSIRAQHTASAAAASPGASSVVSEGSSSSNSSSATYRRRAALEQNGDRCYYDDDSAKISYACCSKLCHNLVSRSFVMQARSVIEQKRHQYTAWARLLSKESRRALLQSMCTSTQKDGRWSHSYTLLLKQGKTEVCQKLWTDIYQLDQNFVSRCAAQPISVPRNRADLKTQSVVRWLEEMQKMHEHMPDTVGAGRDDAAATPSRPRQTGILISFARKIDVYAEYVKDMAEERLEMDAACGSRELCMDGTGYLASESLFNMVWKSRFRHIKLRKSSRFSKCDTCVRLRGFLHDPCHQHDKEGIKSAKEELAEHLNDIKTERAEYHRKRREAVKEPNKYLSIILDGADQGSYGYPHFKEATKTSSGCFKQKYHLIGALVHGRGPWVYTMTNRFAADSNVTIEVLQRVLTDLSNESGGPLPETLYLQLDNCGRENKNVAVMAYLSWLINRKVFKFVEVSFLPVGHTHEDIDQVWSRTGIALKRNDVSCEAELFEIIVEAFHHYGYSPRCGSLDDECRGFSGVANIRDWISEHHIKMSGLSQREVMHLRFSLHDDGPCIQTKNRSTQSWETTKGHIYDTPSKGFHLLLKNTPSPPFAVGARLPPPTNVRVQHAMLMKKLKSALDRFKIDQRVSSAAWKWLAAGIDRLQDTRPVPFSWPLHGQLLCERMHEGAPRHDFALPPISADEMERRARLKHDAEAEHEQRAERAADSDEEDSDDGEDVPPLGLRTERQEKQRVQMVKMAENASQFVVDVLQPGHFVIYIPSDEGRKKAAEGGKKEDGRKFWVGKVYSDWTDTDENGIEILRHGVNRQTGLITVHNYTPYNVKNKQATSNNIASEYGCYMPEYDKENKEKWYDSAWDNVIFMCTHLRDVDGNPEEIGPFAPSYFHLPEYVKKKLQNIFGKRGTRRPARSLCEYVLTGRESLSSKRGKSKRAFAEPVDEDAMVAPDVLTRKRCKRGQRASAEHADDMELDDSDDDTALQDMEMNELAVNDDDDGDVDDAVWKPQQSQAKKVNGGKSSKKSLPAKRKPPIAKK